MGCPWRRKNVAGHIFFLVCISSCVCRVCLGEGVYIPPWQILEMGGEMACFWLAHVSRACTHVGGRFFPRSADGLRAVQSDGVSARIYHTHKWACTPPMRSIDTDIDAEVVGTRSVHTKVGARAQAVSLLVEATAAGGPTGEKKQKQMLR